MLSRARRFSLCLPLLALTALPGCGGHVDDADATADAVTADATSPAALSSSDLPWALDQATIRATNPELSDAEFAVKWTAAKADAFSFLRAFPPAFHADLADVPVARVPGGQGMCLGDAHPANFGFMTEKGQTFFAANDFDDSGYCPVAFDAARFVAAVSIGYGDDSLTGDVVAQYVATVLDASQAVTIDSKLVPSSKDWGKVGAKSLGNDVDDDTFVLSASTGLGAVDAASRAAITRWVAGAKQLASFSLKDIATYAHDAGGSAELARYWLLLAPAGKDDGSRTIIEVKNEVTPAVAWGRHTKVLSDATRFSTLTAAFWPERDTWDTFGATLPAPVAGLYLVRDRLQRTSPDLTSLSKKQLKNVLLTEASELALVHQKAWGTIGEKTLTNWLGGTGDTLAKRWKAAWKAAK